MKSAIWRVRTTVNEREPTDYGYGQKVATAPRGILAVQMRARRMQTANTW